MSRKQTLARVIILLLVTLVGCSQPVDRTPDTPANVIQDQIVPAAQVEADKDVTAKIMPVLEALFQGSTEERRSLLQYVTVGCTTADGLGGPPKCTDGEAEGTLVEVFPVGGTESHFVRPEEIERTLQFTVDGLYAVYWPAPSVDPAEHWPVGEYALLFERQMRSISQPVTVFVQDGKLVRLGFSSHPVDPAQSLNEISLDRILIPPEEAKELTGQVKSSS
jgi:hypothetical protein